MYYKSKIALSGMLVMFLATVFIGKLVNAKALHFESAQFQINGDTYTLEIADIREKRQRGLMFRHTLGAKQGMIFVYPKLGKHRIWMKNTRIILTVLWLDEIGEVIGIKRLEPCLQNPCESYGIEQSSRYIIELNSEHHNVNIGDKIMGLEQI